MRRSLQSLTAAASALTLVGALGASALVGVATPASAQDEGWHDVLFDRETLNVRMSPDGQVRETTLHSHLTVEGEGRQTIADPAATRGLRSMSRLRSPDAEDGQVLWDVQLDGSPTELRSMGDYEGGLPMELDVELSLDGETVTADELQGRDGYLEVTYHLRNVSGAEQDLEFIDEDGEPTTELMEVPLPLAASIDVTLDDRFDDIDPGSAIIAGDGAGGTQMQFSAPLFAPLGEPEAEISFGAQVRDAELPPLRMTVVPVGSHQSPIDTGMESYEEITQALTDIEDGAIELDEGANELAAGASELLDGLFQIADGTSELSAGLREADTGSGELAEGLDEAEAGSGELATGLGEARVGAGELDEGAGELRAGAAEAAAGAQEILDGIHQVEDGVGQLYAGVPEAEDGVRQLLEGAAEIDRVLGVLLEGGEVEDEGTVVAYPGLPFIGAGANELADGLCEFAEDLGGALPQLDEACEGATQLEEAVLGTEQIIDGIRDGVSGPGDETLIGGLGQLEAGLEELGAGIGELLAGAGELAAGGGELTAGLQELAAGTEELDAGTSELASGLVEADEGANELAGGLGEASTGASELSEGLSEAAQGSQELDEGSDEAAEGGEELEDGARQLTDDGTGVLRGEVAAGRADQSRDLALFRATAERGQVDGLPVGAPDGAEQATAAYVYDLAGTSQATGTSTWPGFLAIALIVGGVAATGIGAARRRG